MDNNKINKMRAGNIFILASEGQNGNSYLHFVRAKLKGVNTPPLCGGIKRRSLLLMPRGKPRGGFI
ncbi:MAG: hypothetical protein A2736_02315 [Candidatus Yanofskybacteria bacterium RIFCSPHIGHO2_01_FULL_41_27]|uniref:Uncharacterized protein n=2 Tax=Candidatus Yanofskyibacteriota TaxID=1752733 RepID=A0A1F8HV52_9BACT|nr:MAG: hypothetical protein A2736_02315 [Candidatus Yanofskybacteria bacterium RIFCSPHIGHO2_01_FULL_41_27]OGN08802.1 MAG: hypothetical protein A3C64_02095 [Candidatus Yanofskybacteria bacterium RIFCSPHIGHO2_02_FULL_41_12]OGN21853.1 MAG: hypothetical protein A3B00_01425 [Candidatus Yanofskybacteria bacterium RIFCSPLOWO2_01_FULL_41_33]OGN41431.1 MAG: hypothetical protein A2606_03930 [Candidatus Yanofskybacteria bacterium RIFOXYD1_FULL_42_10]